MSRIFRITSPPPYIAIISGRVHASNSNGHCTFLTINCSPTSPPSANVQAEMTAGASIIASVPRITNDQSLLGLLNIPALIDPTWTVTSFEITGVQAIPGGAAVAAAAPPAQNTQEIVALRAAVTDLQQRMQILAASLITSINDFNDTVPALTRYSINSGRLYHIITRELICYFHNKQDWDPNRWRRRLAAMPQPCTWDDRGCTSFDTSAIENEIKTDYQTITTPHLDLNRAVNDVQFAFPELP